MKVPAVKKSTTLSIVLVVIQLAREASVQLFMAFESLFYGSMLIEINLNE